MPPTSSVAEKIQKRKNKERALKDKKKKRSRARGDEDDRRFSRFEAVASEVNARAPAAAADAAAAAAPPQSKKRSPPRAFDAARPRHGFLK
jgi:hypothetical protein